MMNQSLADHSQNRAPPMANYIPSSVSPNSTLNQQYQQPSPLMTAEQPSHIQYPPTPLNTPGTDASTANVNLQQQMAAMMQQPWTNAGGFPAPYMMSYPPTMMMMPPQPGSDRPASRQSSRPPSRQSTAPPVSSSMSSVNGQTGGQTQTSAAQGILPMQGYPGFLPPGMYNPWFDPYWQSMMASYQNPYNFGYTDEMMNYWRQMSQKDEDRYSHHSAAYSQSKLSQHSSSMQTWGSIDSLNDPYYQNHNALVNGYYSTNRQAVPNQSKRPTNTNGDSNKLLTTATIPNQSITSVEPKTKAVVPRGNEQEEVDEDEDDEDEDDEDEDDDDEGEEESDDASSDRFSIKSDLAQINEESSKARRTPLLYIRPHLRTKFVFDQLIQVLPQSPSDTNQPATVEIISANAIHSMAPSLVQERQLMSDFIGPLTASTAKSNVIRYCERQSQLANKSTNIIDRDALSIIWQYMALLVKNNGAIDVRVDIPKILWSSSNTTVIEDSSTNSNNTSLSSSTLENSLREFLALGEIDTSIKFACENQLYTHALIIAYLTDKQSFEKTIHNIISNLDNGDVLKTFYELGAGSIPSVVSNVTKAHYGDWKRHLAVILANRTDTNADFVDLCIKTMGDTFITSGRIYAGHFCYLIANVPFGSYRNNADKLAVIGSMHAGQSNLSFATIPNLQLTEVYEYSLRKCLSTFIPLKIYYTSKLVFHGLKREALAYCEEIGQTLIRQSNISYVQLVDLQLFILMAEKSRAFSRNFQLDPTSYKEPTWLIELRRIIQNLLDNAFLNKTMRDDTFTSSVKQTNKEDNQIQQQMIPSNYIDKKPGTINRNTEQINTNTTASSVTYPPVTNTNNLNGYNFSNQVPTDSTAYTNANLTNYQNTLSVDTNVNYQVQTGGNYYPPPIQQQQQQQYYPSDSQQTEVNNYAQQWPIQQQQTQEIQKNESDILNSSSQIPSTNNSYYQPSTDQSQYIQPGFTSTPNSYSSQQQSQQWYPSGQVEQRERLPSNEQQQLESMRRRSSIITFNESGSISPSNRYLQSTIDDRRASLVSIQSNTDNSSRRTNSDTANFYYPPSQILRPPTARASISEEPQTAVQQQMNEVVKKRHAIFDDTDDVFPNNTQKSSTTNSNTSTTSTTTGSQAAVASQKAGIVGSLINRLGWRRPVQAHLPDDRNKTLKFDEKTGRWIDTSKPADEQASTQIKPPPMISQNNTSSLSAANPVQQQQTNTSILSSPTTATFSPSMPPASSQSSQPQTLNFGAGSTSTVTTTNTTVPETTAAMWPPQTNTNVTSTTTQQQQQQQQQKPAGQLSAAQQRLQALRQQAAMQQAQAPPVSLPNQFSLKNRKNQSRYVDILASSQVPTNHNYHPIPSANTSTYPPSQQVNDFFVPGSSQTTDENDERTSS